jgi:hypothetical protein
VRPCRRSRMRPADSARPTPLFPEQRAEPDLTFHGEFLDAFDTLSVRFELEDARERAAASAQQGQQARLQEEEQSAGDVHPAHQEHLVVHQSCASAYTQLLQRRCASLREVRACRVLPTPLSCRPLATRPPARLPQPSAPPSPLPPETCAVIHTRGCC